MNEMIVFEGIDGIAFLLTLSLYEITVFCLVSVIEVRMKTEDGYGLSMVMKEETYLVAENLNLALREGFAGEEYFD